MKFFLSFSIYILFFSVSFSVEKSPSPEQKFIPYTNLTVEEKNTEINKIIEEEKKKGSSKEILDYWQEEMVNDVVWFELKVKNFEKAFPQLKNIKKIENCTIDMFVPQVSFLKYEPIIKAKNQVITRKLICEHTEGQKKKDASGVYCHYESSLAYYVNNPENYFSIDGEFDSVVALKIARAWEKGNIFSDYDIKILDNVELKNVSYKNGKYKLSYGVCACGGSVEVTPVTIDGIFKLKIMTEPILRCV